MVALGLAATVQAASLTLDHSPVVLGRTESVGVSIHVDESAGTEARPLRLSVNVGSFGDVTRTGPGEYRSVYVPPITRYPQVALVAVWRETGADAPIHFLRIPLHGMTKINVSAPTGSTVNVEIGMQTFGPVVTDETRAVVVPVEVPPGIPEALIKVREASGKLTQRRAKVDVPPYNRLSIGMVPHALVANGEDWARLEVDYDLGGANVPADRIKVVPSLGSATLQRAERGRYVYKYLPPVGTTAAEVTFAVSVPDDPVASASARLTLGIPQPASVVVSPPVRQLPSDGKSTAPVSALVFDAAGLGLAQQKVEVFANGQPLASPEYKGNGVYQAPFIAPPVYPRGGLVQFSAVVHVPGGALLQGAANYQLQPQATPRSVSSRVAPSPVVADGKTKALLSLDVRDEAGLPLNGAHLILVADTGVLGKLTEVGDGRYQAEYQAPASMAAGGDASVRIVSSSGGFETTVNIPLREGPSFLVGARVGLTHSLGDLVTPRVGVDAWVPFRVGGSFLGLGLSATVGTASQSVAGAGGQFPSESRATFVPVAVRLGYEGYASRRLSVHFGLGGLATWAQVRNSSNRTQLNALAGGGLGFVSGAVTAGPGQFFGELSYAYAPVDNPDFRLNAGGVAVEAGYRFGLF